MKGTNDIYSDTVGYLSRRGIQNKLVIYGLPQLSRRILQSMVLFKPESFTARVFFKAGNVSRQDSMVAVFTKCGETGFTVCGNFFGSKWSGEMKIF